MARRRPHAIRIDAHGNRGEPTEDSLYWRPVAEQASHHSPIIGALCARPGESAGSFLNDSVAGLISTAADFRWTGGERRRAGAAPGRLLAYAGRPNAGSWGLLVRSSRGMPVVSCG